MKAWAGLAGYCAGSMGANFAMWSISSLLLYFLTETVGFSVALATLVITAPKVWDIFVDPLIGAWADQRSARRGNRGGMLMLSAVVLPVSGALVFLMPAQSAPWLAIVVVALLIAASSAFMVFFISHVALADDIEHAGASRRDTVLAVRVVGQAVGSLCAGAIGPMIISSMGDGSAAYRGMALLLAIPSVLGLIAVSFTARGFPTRASPNSTPGAGGILGALQAAIGNRTAGALILSNFSLYVATSVTTTFMPYLNKLLLGEPDSSMAILYSCIMVGMVSGSALAAVVTRRVPRPMALLGATILMTLAAALFQPGSAEGARAIAAGVLLVWGVGLGMYALLIFSAMMDAAGQPLNGGSSSRVAPAARAGLLLGLLISTGKIGDSLGGVLAGAMLSWSGYRAGAAPDDATLQALRLAYTIVPLATMVLALVALLPLLRKVPRNAALSPSSDTGA